MNQQVQKCTLKICTSISARGVSADTEFMQMMSTAPDPHIRSAADKEKLLVISLEEIQHTLFYEKRIAHNNFA